MEDKAGVDSLDILEAGADASIEVSDGDVFPLEQAGAAGGGAMELDPALVAPAPDGGGVDAKNTGDPGSGQRGIPGFPGEPRETGRKAVHQVSPVTFSGSRDLPNQ